MEWGRRLGAGLWRHHAGRRPNRRCNYLSPMVAAVSLHLAAYSGMLRYSMCGLSANLGRSLYSQIDGIIVGKLINEQTLGLYSMAKQLAIMPVTKISVVVNQLASPVMARLQQDQER